MPLVAVDLGDKLPHLHGGGAVEVAGRLVGQHQCRAGSSGRAATATRCFCPPDRLAGGGNRPASPGPMRTSNSRPRGAGHAQVSRPSRTAVGKTTFSSAVKSGSRLWNWKDEADMAVAKLGQGARSSAATRSRPSIR